MLQREMQALGVMGGLEDGQEVVLRDPGFAWLEVPATDSIDWSAVFQSPISIAEGSPR